MRWGLLGVRGGIVLVNLIIAAVIVLSVLPLVSGGLRVDLPENELPRPTIQDNVIKFSIPVDVHNGGYFDINDFRVRFQISDGDVQIVDHASTPVNIIAGRTNHVSIDMDLDLDAIPAEALKKLVFERMTLNLVLGMEAAYTMGLIKASVHTNQSMNWEPLIDDFTVNTHSIHTQTNGTNLDILVPYSFRASDMVTGNAVSLHASLSNSTALLGTADHALILQANNQGELRFTIDQQTALWLMAHPEDLTIGTDLVYQEVGFHREYVYRWGGMP